MKNASTTDFMLDLFELLYHPNAEKKLLANSIYLFLQQKNDFDKKIFTNALENCKFQAKIFPHKFFYQA